MEIKAQLPFHQLLAIVKALTPTQKARLKKELDETPVMLKEDKFFDFLLKGPVYTDTDIAIIEENRKSISEWRTKD